MAPIGMHKFLGCTVKIPKSIALTFLLPMMFGRYVLELYPV